MMVILLGFGAMGWAGEASVFDPNQIIIIRASTACTVDCATATPKYSAFLEARDSDGVCFVGNQLVVTKLAPVQVETLTSTVTGDDFCDRFKIHNDDLTSPDVSITFDSRDGITYVFCTEQLPGGLHVMKFDIAVAGPPVSGTLNDIADSGTNYLWNCKGLNGGTDASCSLAKPVNGVCGATNNACTSGTLNDIADSGTNYLWNCTGLNGGTDASCSLAKPVNGVCGSSNGGTFTSAPTTNLCSAGTPTSVTGSGPWTWTCSGLNGGNPSPTCSAQIQSTGGSVDLIVVSMTGISSSYEYGGSFNVNWSVKNQGTAPSGPFTVKLYQNGSKAMGGSLLFTASVSGLAAGQSTGGTNSVSTSAICSIHVYCYFNLWVDADNQVAESNETNNEKSGQSERAR
jgi:hypothetical protein